MTMPLVATVDEMLELLEDDEKPCIICPCRPQITFCGRLDDTPCDGFAEMDGSDCDECTKVLINMGCPNCLCTNYQDCNLCCD